MKQIALVLFLTAMAAVGFVVTSKLSESGSRRDQPNVPAPAGTGDLRAPTGQRPTLGGERSQELIIPPELQAKLDAKRNFDWKPGADPGSVVQMDAAWDFDLSEVDFDAEVLVNVDGRPVHRDRLRAFVLLDRVAPLVEARLNLELARMKARQRGLDVSLTDAEYDRMFDLDAVARGQDPETARATLATMSRMPMEPAYTMRRWVVEAMLAMSVGAEDSTAVSSFLDPAALMQDPAMHKAIVEGMNEGWQQVADARAKGEPAPEEALNRINGGLQGISLLGGSALGDELAYRVWTFLDDPSLDPAHIAAMTLGDVTPGQMVPPWTIAGDRWHLEVDELWPAVSDGLTREALEESLSSLLYYDVLQDDLVQRGVALGPEEAWEVYAEEYVRAKNTILGMHFLHCELEGFPTLHHYRALQGLKTGFERTLPAGWQDDASLAPFYERNRFYIEGWKPTLTMALFPAVDPSQPITGGDWEAAEAAARAMREEVAAGEDFGELVNRHNAQMIDRMREYGGEDAAKQLEEEVIAPTRTARGLTEIDDLLNQNYYEQLTRTTSIARAAAAHLEPGEVSQPWRTPVGYVLVRVEGAQLGDLESEFEDERFRTDWFYKISRYQKWANDTLRAAQLGAGS